MIKEIILKQHSKENNWYYTLEVVTERGSETVINGEGKDLTLGEVLKDQILKGKMISEFLLEEMIYGINTSYIIYLPAKIFMLISDRISSEDWNILYSFNNQLYSLKTKYDYFSEEYYKARNKFFTEDIIPILNFVPYRVVSEELTPKENLTDHFNVLLSLEEDNSQEIELDEVSKFLLNI